jgi:hypothetical protein
MNIYRTLALILTLLSSTAIANEYSSPVNNINIYSTDLTTLAIQNLSKEVVEIDIHGNTFYLVPASGAQLNCSSYEQLELQIKHNDHPYFQVPCNSRVIINEFFTNQYTEEK